MSIENQKKIETQPEPTEDIEQTWSRGTIIKWVKDFYEQNGRLPTNMDLSTKLKKGNSPSARIIEKIFRSQSMIGLANIAGLVGPKGERNKPGSR